LSGRVVDELDKGPNIDLVIHCLNSGKKAKDMLLLVEEEKITGDGTLTVKCNFMSADRQLAGFRGISLEKNEGDILKELGPHPDPRHFLLGYLPC